MARSGGGDGRLGTAEMAGDLAMNFSSFNFKAGGTRRRRGRGRPVAGLLAVWLGGAALAAASDADPCRNGYRAQSTISDFTLGRDWTVYASCAHPEAPRIALADDPAPASPAEDRSLPPVLPVAPPARRTGSARDRLAGPTEVSSSAAPVAPPPLLVRSGDRVRVWASTPVAQIELPGTALENGAAGAMVRVRAMPGGKLLRGWVRGEGSVELEAGEGFRGAGQ